MPKYIFVTGAPGSKWSSVVKNIYSSPSIDQSDFSKARTYWHSAGGQPELMHLGAYFDPGMEFGRRFMRLPQLTKSEVETEFDRPFNGTGIRIIKSHVFSHHLDCLKATWPDCPIVLVRRDNDACLGWWVRCGQFNITYPNYQYYSNLEMMAMHIDQQNQDIDDFALQHSASFDIEHNQALARRLGIEQPPYKYKQLYNIGDIEVAVI